MSHTDDDVQALAELIGQALMLDSADYDAACRLILDHLTANGWAKRADVLENMMNMDLDARADVLAHFCHSCQRVQDPERPCKCWNDE